MPETIDTLNVFLPLLVVLLLNWLFRQTAKPIRKLDRRTRRQIKKTGSSSAWHKIWGYFALLTGSGAVFVFIFLALSRLEETGLRELPSSLLPFLPGVVVGLVLIASGQSSLLSCRIDALATLLIREKAARQGLEEKLQKEEERKKDAAVKDMDK